MCTHKLSDIALFRSRAPAERAPPATPRAHPSRNHNSTQQFQVAAATRASNALVWNRNIYRTQTVAICKKKNTGLHRQAQNQLPHGHSPVARAEAVGIRLLETQTARDGAGRASRPHRRRRRRINVPADEDQLRPPARTHRPTEREGQRSWPHREATQVPPRPRRSGYVARSQRRGGVITAPLAWARAETKPRHAINVTQRALAPRRALALVNSAHHVLG